MFAMVPYCHDCHFETTSRFIPQGAVEEFLMSRYRRQHPGTPGGVAPGWAATTGSFAVAPEALTPAETSLLKSLTVGATGGGVAGMAGVDRLMRVMINAPDVSCRAHGRVFSYTTCNSTLHCLAIVSLLFVCLRVFTVDLQVGAEMTGWRLGYRLCSRPPCLAACCECFTSCFHLLG